MPSAVESSKLVEHNLKIQLFCIFITWLLDLHSELNSKLSLVRCFINKIMFLQKAFDRNIS